MTEQTKRQGWQGTVNLGLVLIFSGFVLWLTASNLDSSEVKTILGLAGVQVGREFLPMVKQWLMPTTELLSRGGRLE